MKVLVLAAAALFLLVAPAAAAEPALVPVHQFVEGMNKNDAKLASAAFAQSHALTDEFAPFYWHGQDGFQKWYQDFGAYAQKNNVTEPALKLVKRKVLTIEGDKAYYVATALFTFKQAGNPVTETGVVTFGLSRSHAGWRITSFTWATT